MAFPLMAIGAGLGIAADQINKQRQQQAALQMQQMRFAREMQMLKLALDQKNQTQQASLALGALDPSAAIRGDAGATSLPAAPGANNSPYVGSAGGFNLSTAGAPQGAASPTFGSNAFEPMTAMPSPSGGGGNWETQHNNFAGMRIPGVVAGPNAGGFQSFATPEAGIQAISRQLDRYASGATTGTPLTTLRQIVSTWAPPSENPTDQLISRASRVMGVPPDQPLDLANPQVKGKLVEAMIRGEQGGRLPIDPGVIQRALGGAAQPETQVAQAGPQTATDAGPQMPQLPPPPDLIGIRQRAVQQVGSIPGLTPQQREAYANSVVNLAKSQWEVQKQQVEFQATQQNRALADQRARELAKGRGTHYFPTDKGEMAYDPVSGQSKPIEFPGGAKVVSGRGATEKFGDINDLMNRWHQDFVKQQGREPTTDEIATRHAELAQQSAKPGQNAQNVAERIMIGGNEVSKSLDALTALGPGATLGIFGGAQAALGSGLVDNIKRNFANKLVSRNDQLVASFGRGIGRGLAQLIGAGSAQGLQNLSEQLMKDLPQDNDDWATVLSKFANMRDSADGALEVLGKDPRLTKDQKDEIKQIMDNIHKVVPFTRKDVAKMMVDESDESIAQFAQKMGIGGGGGAGGPPPEAIAHLRGDKDPNARANFDAVFGQGAAAKALGQ